MDWNGTPVVFHEQHGKRFTGICRCGHLEAQHCSNVVNMGDMIAREEGHGDCAVKGCDCQKMRWKEFVNENEAAEIVSNS